MAAHVLRLDQHLSERLDDLQNIYELRDEDSPKNENVTATIPFPPEKAEFNRKIGYIEMINVWGFSANCL